MLLLYYWGSEKRRVLSLFPTSRPGRSWGSTSFEHPARLLSSTSMQALYWTPCKEARLETMKKRRLPFLFVLLTLLGGWMIPFTQVAHAQTTSTLISSSCIIPGSTNVMTGTLPPDGASYIISVPSNWNGTLALYSHGYVFPGQPNPAKDAGDSLTEAALLNQGYALAGSAYSAAGWALQQAFQDQIALLDFFDTTCGQPLRTIAWGHSLGGIITAGLVQLNPGRFDGALPMCGVLAGGVGTWDAALDSAFAFQVLLGAGVPLQVVHITNPPANFQEAEQLLGVAQATPQGQARLA